MQATCPRGGTHTQSLLSPLCSPSCAVMLPTHRKLLLMPSAVNVPPGRLPLQRTLSAGRTMTYACERGTCIRVGANEGSRNDTLNLYFPDLKPVILPCWCCHLSGNLQACGVLCSTPN